MASRGETGTFVAVGAGTTQSNIITSPDGTNWTARRSVPVASAATNLYAVTYGTNAGFVAVGAGAHAYTSPNGATWSSVPTLPGGSPSLHHVVYGNGIYLASYGSSTNLIIKYQNFLWSSLYQSSGTPVNFGPIAFVNGLFIAAGYSTTLNTNVFLTSADGTNWLQHGFYHGAGINGMTFDGRRLVAIGKAYPDSLVFTSDPFVSLGMASKGSPQLNISGVVGGSYRIDYLNTLLTNAGNNWQPLTNFTLPSSPYTWTDTQTSNSQSRFYRAVLLP